MVRVALAQVFYKPAIVEKTVDHLAEPGFVRHDVSTASLLVTLSEEKSMALQTMHSQIREQYITYIGQKLKEICGEACRIHKPDVLVFPEYSVPYQCLPEIKEMATHLGITIVAGTHTVLPVAKEYYAQAGLAPEIASRYKGCSISPIFFPNEAPDYQVKNDRSIFEITMQESDEGFKRFKTVTSDGKPYCFSVVICADALTLSTVGKVDTTADNFMILTVACSTNTKVFEKTAGLFALHGIPMLICNASQYGGSGIYLPDTVQERFTNTPGQSSYMEAKKEALMFLDFLPDQFFVKRGIMDTTVRGNWAVCPIFYYGKQLKWKKDYLKALQKTEHYLKEGDTESATENVEILLSLYEGQLPDSLVVAFNHFMANIGNFCGDTQSYVLPLRAILLDIHSTEAHLYHEFPQMIDFCVNVGKNALSQITALIEQRDLPLMNYHS